MSDLTYMMGFLKAQLFIITDEPVLSVFKPSFINSAKSTLHKLIDLTEAVEDDDKFKEGFKAFAVKSFFNFSDEILLDRLLSAYEWSNDDFIFPFSSYDYVIESDYYTSNVDDPEFSDFINFIDTSYKKYWRSFYSVITELVRFLNMQRFEEDIEEVIKDIKKRLDIDLDAIDEESFILKYGNKE